MLIDPPRFVPRADSRPDDTPWPTMLWPIARDVTLTGAHVSLSPRDPATDGDPLWHALDDERVWAHQPGRPADAAGYTASLTGPAATWCTWTVRLARRCRDLSAGTVVGTTSYLDASPADARLEIGATAYARAVWASAVNPEAKLLLLAYAFDELHAGRVQLKTDVRNHRSQQAIARLGAQYEGTLRRYQRRRDGSVRDTVFFSITAEDWPGVRERLQQRLSLSLLST